MFLVFVFVSMINVIRYMNILKKKNIGQGMANKGPRKLWAT